MCFKLLTEKFLAAQLTDYLVSNNLIGEEFHGFIPGRGTVTGELKMLEQLQAGVDRGDI